MIFGDPATFAVEAGAFEDPSLWGGLYLQFRFWIDGQPIGDWEDRIQLTASIGYAGSLCETECCRREWLFHDTSPEDIFQAVYDGFFEYDYTNDPILNPNLRDRFHVDDIGMGAVEDKYGLVLVGSSTDAERLIVKDLRKGIFLADVSLPFGFVESVLNVYIEWGRSQLRAEGERPK